MCLAVFGVYLTSGAGGAAVLCSLTTLTSLLQQFLVALVTRFCRALDAEAAAEAVEDPESGEAPGSGVSPDLVAAISQLQSLAYRSLVSRAKLLTDGDLDSALQHLRAALEARASRGSDVTPRVTFNGEEGGEVNGHEEGGEGGRGGGGVTARTGGGGGMTLTDVSLLSRSGLLAKVGVGVGRVWGFTCSLTRDFLAARHLADMSAEALSAALEEQKVLRHPRFAQTTAFLCSLLHEESEDSEALASLVSDISIQVRGKGDGESGEGYFHSGERGVEDGERGGEGGRGIDI